MLAPKMWNKNVASTEAEKTTSVPAKSITPAKPAPNKTNSCCATEESLILGTWLSVDDTLTKWVFQNDGIVRMYHADTLFPVDPYSYRITNETTLCGYALSAGYSQNIYMEWTNVNDPGDKMCFSIDGLTDEVLNVVLFGSGKFNIFKRPGSDFQP